MGKLWKWMLTSTLAIIAMSCSAPISPSSMNNTGDRAAAASSLTLTGTNGSIVLSGMSGSNLTVSYTPTTSITWAHLYLTQGNGTGLVAADQNMPNSSGTYSFTVNSSTFVAGATIGVDVLQMANGVETSVPQGTLGDSSTWKTFAYAASTTNAFTVTYDSQGATTAASPSTQTVSSPATTVGTLPAAPLKTGSTFAGWFTAVNGGGTAFTGSTAVTANLTVYANWTSSTSEGLTLTGTNGSVVLSGMTNHGLTVSYTPASPISSANLYVSQGNGMGLILASQAMTLTGSTYSYTLTNASFVSGAKIYLDILQNAAGVETNVPQGTLGTVSTWANFTYASSTTNPPGSYTVTFDSQGATSAASPTSITVTSPATTVGSLPSAPVKTGSTFLGWFTAPNGGGTSFTAATTVTASLTVYASWSTSTALNFGPNVIIFDPSMSSSTIQSQLNSLYAAQRTNQFGPQRYAVMFKPGTYNVNVNVGFYMQILGLGQSPDSTNIVGSIQADGSYDPNYNVTQNFWRAAENIAVTPTAQSYDMWAVSQAAPLRRVHVKGGLWLFNINPATGQSGWASGGFLSDTLVDGQVNSGGQQQWFSRNSQWGSWSGSVWNMVFAGNVNQPSSSFPNPPNTSLSSVPTVREKPYLYIDSSGNYNVFVPSLRTNSSGVSWASGNTPGTALPISTFYVAHSNTDSAASINAALSQGKNLLLTPGVYTLNGSIQVTRANTVVLGLGMATLLTASSAPAMTVADVDGVTIAGILFDAGPVNTPYQLQVGPSGSSASHASNPTLLSDLFFRVGGVTPASTTESLEINSNNVIGDDFWIWRADHGAASNSFGWTNNPAQNGLVVNGTNVIVYGLAVEHYQKYQTLWNGNGGQVYFYQSEEPYDVPNQAAWMNGSQKGYPSYKVADSVSSHTAYGLGVYCFFNVNNAVQVDNAMEVPASGLHTMLHNLTTVSLGGVGTINHILNGLGATADSTTNLQTLTP